MTKAKGVSMMMMMMWWLRRYDFDIYLLEHDECLIGMKIKTTAGSSFTHSTDYEWTHLEKWLSMGCVREFCQEICSIQFEFKKLTPISSKKWFPFSFTHPSNDKQTNRILIIAMRKNKFSHAEMCCRLLT